MQPKKKILLHVCCAPCATACIEKLTEKDFEITLFYSNSNINTFEEFEKRKKEVMKLAKIMNLSVIFEDYEHKKWLEFVKGYEKEKEKGKRCELCFKFNLDRTYTFFKENFDFFTTSLTVSPHKNSKTIFEIGKRLEGFKDFDFKKEDGFKKSIKLSEKYNLYRQNYCGCEFSLRISR